MRSLARTAAAAVLIAFAAAAQDTPKKISRAEALSAVSTKVPPDYPPMAKQLKIEGVVELEAVVAEDGAVTKVNIVSGNPVLTAPAAQALKRWKFKPFVEEGKTIQVLAPVNIVFKM